MMDSVIRETSLRSQRQRILRQKVFEREEEAFKERLEKERERDWDSSDSDEGSSTSNVPPRRSTRTSSPHSQAAYQSPSTSDGSFGSALSHFETHIHGMVIFFWCFLIFFDFFCTT